ncbi:MAG TPA: hypothetical protein PLL72_15485 [Burkholderiaceae bacterium]|nr:hypothetical protein [Burkholderiaceae bacterium]
MTNELAGKDPVDRQVVPLVARLRDEADLCRNEGAADIARLLDEAAEEMHNLAWALSLPGFDRMATDAQEAEHQAGVQLVNDVLARMEKARAEHDAMVRDAARYRWLAAHARSTAEHWGGRWSLVIEGPAPARNDCEDAIDAAVDEAMKRRNKTMSGIAE